jgi:hypothetical protein
MIEEALTREEIDQLIYDMDEPEREKKRELKLRKKTLKEDAQTAKGVVEAIRDHCMGEDRTCFILTDEEAEQLVIRYAKKDIGKEQNQIKMT